MAEVRVVVDTNVWLNYLFFNNTATMETVERLFSEECIVIASDQTLEEVRIVLNRNKFDRILPLDLHLAFFFEVGALSEVIVPTSTVTACRDPRDNMFLEAALDGDADYLITRDKDLLSLAGEPNAEWRFRIVTPGEFLAEVGTPIP